MGPTVVTVTAGEVPKRREESGDRAAEIVAASIIPPAEMTGA